MRDIIEHLRSGALDESFTQRVNDKTWSVEDGFVKGTVTVNDDDSVTVKLEATFEPAGYAETGGRIDRARAAATTVLDSVTMLRKSLAKLKTSLLSTNMR